MSILKFYVMLALEFLFIFDVRNRYKRYVTIHEPTSGANHSLREMISYSLPVQEKILHHFQLRFLTENCMHTKICILREVLTCAFNSLIYSYNIQVLRTLWTRQWCDTFELCWLQRD